MNSPVNLQEEYAKTEIAKILNLLDEELIGLAPVKSRIQGAHSRKRFQGI